MAAVAVESKASALRLSEEKGAWIRRLWQGALADMSGIGGCRLLWNSLFFAVPDMTIEEAMLHFGRLLRSAQDPLLESLCVLSPVMGTPEQKLVVLDGVEHEASAFNFGRDSECWHTGSKFYHLRDGEFWPLAKAGLKQMESIA